MPSTNLLRKRLQADAHDPRALRGPIACALLAIWLACTAPAVYAMPGRAAAGMQTRAAASQDLEAARREVQAAQVECKRTRSALDTFLADHLDAQAQAAAEDAASDAQRLHQAKLCDQLRAELAELQAKRESLLETLTEVHPEVLDVTARMEAIEGRIAAASPEGTADGNSPESENSGRSLDAAEYRRLLGDWQTAERRLDSARLAETAAADRLNAVTELLLHSPTPETLAPPRLAEPAPMPAPTQPEPAGDAQRDTDARAAAAPSDAGDGRASRTQSLALASLALAVMLAALAAVRLARSSADPLFASADEVSAALAVPVVGLVPFGAKSGSKDQVSGIQRGLLLIAQVAIALLVFGAVAYVVVHFDAVLHFLGDPVETLRSWLGL